MLRRYLLDHAFESAKERMRLRKPQLDSLREFHAIFSDLPGKLSETKGEDIADLFQAHHPEWASNGIFPEMTFALATSVGKTRLMGALMSYLFTSGESRNFLI